ncbi:DEKNAAC103619 [Brettanomyces naardenensis]|uniref:DEKNAAC103619 n=1 Tax=Brettanomyces naardenensis TaxID=13370 RepID=A0A448YNZ9_BRENA|nr:DEKNAAC103619 [Brettanomyces naardenensis]
MTEALEEVLARHKKEERDLVSRTTGMKKQANKRNRKQVMKHVRELEEELRQRHKSELEEVKGGESTEDSGEKVTPEMLLAQLELEEKSKEERQGGGQEVASSASNSTPSHRRNRQRERIAKREAAIKEKQEQARIGAENVADPRNIEVGNIEELCRVNQLVAYEITPDGHCLFASIADQLKRRQDIEMSVHELRSKAAEYIRSNPDTFTPFLFDESTMSLRDIGEYTKELENTAMWGGDLEILALSKVFDSPISVMMSGRAALKINEEGQQPELKIVFYQHSYGLGEHYNSLRDVGDVEEGDGFIKVEKRERGNRQTTEQGERDPERDLERDGEREEDSDVE